MSHNHRAISFSPNLAAQERDIKLAALMTLNTYLNRSGADIGGEKFWSFVEEFEEETDGLNTPSYDGIVPLGLADSDVPELRRLGFRVIEGGTVY